VKAIPAAAFNDALHNNFEKSKKEVKSISSETSQSLSNVISISKEIQKISKKISNKRKEISNVSGYTDGIIKEKVNTTDISEKRVTSIRKGPTVGEELKVFKNNTKLKEKPINNAKVKKRLERGKSGVIVKVDTLWESYLVEFGDKRGWVWSLNVVPKKEWENVQRQKDNLESELSEANSQLEELRSSIKSFNVERRKRNKKLNAIVDKVREDLDHAKRYRSNEFYFSSLPSPSDVDKTDSSGEYELNVKSGMSYYVVAQAERSVGDDTERYYWAVETPVEGGEMKELNLNNDNLGGIANRKYALSERELSTVRKIWEASIGLAREGEELDWGKLIYRTAFPQDTTGTPIPDDLDVPEQKLLSGR
jgi:hypothetical protein